LIAAAYASPTPDLDGFRKPLKKKGKIRAIKMAKLLNIKDFLEKWRAAPDENEHYEYIIAL
jgi:hypothetical protein